MINVPMVLCRDFYYGTCNRPRCRFYHPKQITEDIRKEAVRRIGFCFCGARIRNMINNRGRDEDPLFYTVCSKTKKSIKRCM